MQSGRRPRATAQQPLAEDEFEDEAGNLFLRYPIVDDPSLAKLVPTL